MNFSVFFYLIKKTNTSLSISSVVLVYLSLNAIPKFARCLQKLPNSCWCITTRKQFLKLTQFSPTLHRTLLIFSHVLKLLNSSKNFKWQNVVGLSMPAICVGWAKRCFFLVILILFQVGDRIGNCEIRGQLSWFQNGLVYFGSMDMKW